MREADLESTQYSANKEATVRWLQKDETTFTWTRWSKCNNGNTADPMYMRVEHTEGIVRSRLQRVLLERNLPSDAKDSSDEGQVSKAAYCA